MTYSGFVKFASICLPLLSQLEKAEIPEPDEIYFDNDYLSIQWERVAMEVFSDKAVVVHGANCDNSHYKLEDKTEIIAKLKECL